MVPLTICVPVVEAAAYLSRERGVGLHLGSVRVDGSEGGVGAPRNIKVLIDASHTERPIFSLCYRNYVIAENHCLPVRNSQLRSPHLPLLRYCRSHVVELHRIPRCHLIGPSLNSGPV